MKQNTILLTYLCGMGRLNQKRARKSSEHVRNAASVGECVIKRTAPLCPRESSCFLEAFRESQQHRDVVTSSGNIT